MKTFNKSEIIKQVESITDTGKDCIIAIDSDEVCNSLTCAIKAVSVSTQADRWEALLCDLKKELYGVQTKQATVFSWLESGALTMEQLEEYSDLLGAISAARLKQSITKVQSGEYTALIVIVKCY